jgi:hypothetical protein
MTYEEVATMIETVGLPFAYDHFTETAQEPPFICFIFPESNDVIADNKNYQKIKKLQIELYTDNKDFALEHRLEGILNSYELPYTDNEAYLDSERMYMHTYNTEVVIYEQD